MDIAVRNASDEKRHALLWTALAPLIPQLLGSVFNIWYNATIISPLLGVGDLRQRFFQTVIVYNLVAYPVGVLIWLWKVFSLRPVFERLRAGLTVEEKNLTESRRRLIHLPWWAAAISSAAWLLCIPVFLGSLAQVPGDMDMRLFRHLPISFCVSAFIAITNTFFLVELASHWGLFPVFFKGVRPDLTPGTVTLSLRGRGLLWAISAAVCPIISLLLLVFAPPSMGSDPRWLAVFVGAVGIGFGLCTALMISRLVATPVDQLRRAAQAVSQGHFDVLVPVVRADEFGLLIGEFNQMTRGLREREKLRRAFGLHVGQQAAEQILARDPGLGGVEMEITVMFVDIRSFTTRAGMVAPHETLELLNKFLSIAVRVVEEKHQGMINKYLGDGFMALFGVGSSPSMINDAQNAFDAGCGILRSLDFLNRELVASKQAPLEIGIGLHSGPAIVGSIGSPQRLEFTAIGSTVNLASRIENLTKQLATPMLMTDEIRARLARVDGLIELPPQEVRGVDRLVRVFALRQV